MSIANTKVTWRPVGPVVVIGPHVPAKLYVNAGAGHVAVMFTVTEPPLVRPV